MLTRGQDLSGVGFSSGGLSNALGSRSLTNNTVCCSCLGFFLVSLRVAMEVFAFHTLALLVVAQGG